MKQETYKGYTLHIKDVVSEPNGQKTQTVLVYKDGNVVSAAFADLQFEDAILKAKAKIDKFNN